MLAQIGWATVAWAHLEILLDFANWSVVHHLQKREPFPVALGRKLNLFRRAHNQIAALDPLKANALALADDIGALSVKRNDMIHGRALNDLSDDVIKVYRHVVPKGLADNHLVFAQRRAYTSQEFSGLASEMFDLAHRMAAHASLVAETLGTKDKIHDLTR